MDPQPATNPPPTDTPIAPKIPKDSHGITVAALAIFILLALGAVAFLYYQNQQLKSMLASYQTPAPTPTATTDPTASWKTYTSLPFSYSFKYPTTWSVLMFNEVDPKILYGSNSLQSYSPTEVEKYMDHGLIDWASYLKDKPAIKIDFAVYSKKPGPNQYQDKKEFLDNLLNKSAKKLDASDLKIGNQLTEQYKATEDLGPTDVPEINTFVAYPDDDRIIYMNLFFWNIKSYELLKKTPEWQEFSQILSTFKFTAQTLESPGRCTPTYRVETNTPELSAKQQYSLECTKQKTSSGCLGVDLYNKQKDSFSTPDGVPDCRWDEAVTQ